MITIIAAVAKDGCIGRKGLLPWRLKSDMEHFVATTTGHTVIMGRKTWDTIPKRFRPLVNRRNIVLSRNHELAKTGAQETASSFEEALAISENDEQVFIMGGAEIYRQALPLAERLILTHVDARVPDGDANFPLETLSQWHQVSLSAQERHDGDQHSIRIGVYFPKLRYIELANVRTLEQLRNMRQIRAAGHCPLCLENLAKYHSNPIIYNGNWWLVTPNQWPYPDTQTHLLLIPKEHIEIISDLTIDALAEFKRIMENLEKQGFIGGGVCVRSGDPLLSGATVKHLHVQVIAPKPGAKVKFYIGTSANSAALL